MDQNKLVRSWYQTSAAKTFSSTMSAEHHSGGSSSPPSLKLQSNLSASYHPSISNWSQSDYPVTGGSLHVGSSPSSLPLDQLSSSGGARPKTQASEATQRGLSIEEKPSVKEDSEGEASASCGHLKVQVIEGSLHEIKADVLVNTTAANLKLNHGQVSSAILMAAGMEIQQECWKKFPNGLRMGEMAVTKGYKLECKYVFHGTLPKFNHKNEVESIQQFKKIEKERAKPIESPHMSAVSDTVKQAATRSRVLKDVKPTTEQSTRSGSSDDVKQTKEQSTRSGSSDDVKPITEQSARQVYGLVDGKTKFTNILNQDYAALDHFFWQRNKIVYH